jgi:mannan endo-1,4-beta-mannosidase
VATATPVPESSETQSTARHEESPNNLLKRASFPSVTGLKFNIDGSTAYYAGTNTYWIVFLTSNTDVDTVMSHLNSSGLKVLRVWGESLSLHTLNPTNIIFRLQ